MHSMMFGNISGLYPLGASGELPPRVAKMSLILPDVPGKVISPAERTTRGNCFVVVHVNREKQGSCLKNCV